MDINPPVMEKIAPYDQGFRARLRGDGADANPHPELSVDRAQWAEGWIDQNQHLADRDAALDSIGWFG